MVNKKTISKQDVTGAELVLRKIGFEDLKRALRLGYEDFNEKPSDTIFLCLIYPVIGLILFKSITGGSFMSLAFPLISGFALVGPVAAL